MTKLLNRGFLTVGVFGLLWAALFQVDWMTVFNVKNNQNELEQKLGELIWDNISSTEIENTDQNVVEIIDSLVNKLCSANNIEREYIKVHIIDKSDINAFALPDGHLVLYSGLIINAEYQNEVAGVICHELAHIQLKHVMKKLVKEIGISTLLAMTTGSSGSDVFQNTVGSLTSTAFDRSLEKEADLKAITYLKAANVDPEGLANFLYKMSLNESDLTKYLTWVSTHPDSEERTKYIVEQIKNDESDYEDILSEESWSNLKEMLSEEL